MVRVVASHPLVVFVQCLVSGVQTVAVGHAEVAQNVRALCVIAIRSHEPHVEWTPQTSPSSPRFVNCVLANVLHNCAFCVEVVLVAMASSFILFNQKP